MSDTRRPLKQEEAMRIIESLGGDGTPPHPKWVPYLSVGCDDVVNTIAKTYFTSGNLGTSTKIVVAANGNGKTNFLFHLWAIAASKRVAASYVKLSPNDATLTDIATIYRAILTNLSAPDETGEVPDGDARGFLGIVQDWINANLQGPSGKPLLPHERDKLVKELAAGLTDDLPSVRFASNLRRFIDAVVHKKPELETDLRLWFTLEQGKSQEQGPPIKANADKGGVSALECIRSVAKVVERLGYTGLLVIFDEAEQSSIGTLPQKKKLAALNNLLDLRNERSCPNTLFLYATTSEFDNVIELMPALQTAYNKRFPFTLRNPVGSRIELEQFLGMSSGSVGGDAFGQNLAHLGQRIHEIWCIAQGDAKSPGRATLERLGTHAAEDPTVRMRTFVRASVAALGDATSAGDELSAAEIEELWTREGDSFARANFEDE